MAESPFSLAGKAILVTGASSGIGRACAVLASHLGAKLALVARNEQRLDETLALLEGDGHTRHVLDLADVDAIPKFITSLCKQIGPLAGLVHSAGIHQIKPLRVVKGADLEQLFRVNAVAGVMLVKGLSARNNYVPGASAVMISSVMGHVAQPGLVSYCMSKGALEMAVKVLALELAGQRIRVNAVAPANLQTPMGPIEVMVGKEAWQQVLRMHPMGFGEVEQVAGPVTFLLSDAASYVTGASLLADGGYCAQ